jgi:hypothetical protein
MTPIELIQYKHEDLCKRKEQTERSKRLHEWIKTPDAQRIKNELNNDLFRELMIHQKSIVEFSPVVYILSTNVSDSDIEFLMGVDKSIWTEGKRRFIRLKLKNQQTGLD